MEEHLKDDYNLVEYDDYWIIPLRGASVAKIVIDLVLRIEFWDINQLETIIWIGGEIQLKRHGNVQKLQGDNPRELAPILELWGNTVDSAMAHKDGKLEIKFETGQCLIAHPLPATEAWGVTGQRWLRIACMPGGDVAVWKPDPEEIRK